MPKFREGNVVIGVGEYEGINLTNITGVIRIVDEGMPNRNKVYGVVWDKNIGGHDLMGNCQHGYGWWVSEAVISLHDLVLENK